MRYDVIIWDWNGTLLNDAFLCRDIMNGILAGKKLPIMTAERYQEIFDFPVSSYYRKLGFDFEKDSFETLGTAFIEAYEKRKHEAELQPGAHRLLTRAAGNNIRQSVLSAYHHDALVKLLSHRKLDAFFDRILGADDHYAYGKEEQGKRLISHLQPAPGKAVLIGDTQHDYYVASAIGVDCILVEGGHQSRDRLKTCPCPVANNLAEVEQLLTE